MLLRRGLLVVRAVPPPSVCLQGNKGRSSMGGKIRKAGVLSFHLVVQHLILDPSDVCTCQALTCALAGPALMCAFK